MKVAYKRLSSNLQESSCQLHGLSFDKEFVEYARAGHGQKRLVLSKSLLIFSGPKIVLMSTLLIDEDAQLSPLRILSMDCREKSFSTHFKRRFSLYSRGSIESFRELHTLSFKLLCSRLSAQLLEKGRPGIALAKTGVAIRGVK